MVATSQNGLVARIMLMLGASVIGITTASAAEIQGFTEPYRDIDVAAAEMGIVAAIDVKEGDRVTKNQVLVQMDASVLEATLEIARSIKESHGRLESALEELQLQTKMIGKLTDLQTRQHASEQELERALAQQRIAEAHVKAIREELSVKTLEYQRTQVQLEQKRLTSPIDGIVTRIFKDHGESVSLSEPVVVKVVQLDPLLAVFLVPANLTPELEKGKQVNVKFPDTAQVVEASVEFVSPTADPKSGLSRVSVRLPNPDERLPCGATCYLLLAGQNSSRLASTD